MTPVETEAEATPVKTEPNATITSARRFGPCSKLPLDSVAYDFLQVTDRLLKTRVFA